MTFGQSQTMKQQKKKTTTKKFKYLKSSNPIYFLQLFQYQNKTHYVISQSSLLYVGYMQKYCFNQISQININSYVMGCNFNQNSGNLMIGLKNGSIMYGKMDAIYQEIPLQVIESVNGKAILGILQYYSQLQRQYCIITVDQTPAIRQYVKNTQTNKYKHKRQLLLQSQIGKVICKHVKNYSTQPCLMIELLNTKDYPLLLTLKQIQSSFKNNQNNHNKDQLSQWNKSRQEQYMKDQILLSKLTSIDFDPIKRTAVLGYDNGIIQFFNIQLYPILSQNKQDTSEQFNIILPHLQIKKKQEILHLSLINQQTQPILGYVTQKVITGFNYKFLRNNSSFSKITNGKHINLIKFTKDKYILISSISNEGKIREPKVYCVDQDL